MEYREIRKIAELIAIKQSGEKLSELHEQQLTRWIERDEQNEKTYRRLMSGDSLDQRIRLQKTFDVVAAQAKIHRSIRRKTLRRRITAAVGVAAVVVCALLLLVPNEPESQSSEAVAQHIVAGDTKAILTLASGETVTLTKNDDPLGKTLFEKTAPAGKNPRATLNRIEVPRGSEYHFTMSDGTKVWLNSQTVMEFPSSFDGGQREVTLSGEAYFEVSPNPHAPFEVSLASELKVKVLGTGFNVCSYSDLSDVRVTLVHGSVAMLHRDGNKVLKPNEQGVFDKKSKAMSVTEVPDAMSFCAWKNGLFVFENQPIETILDAVSKWYDVKIVFDSKVDPKALGHFSMNVTKYESLDPILKLIGQITGLRYEISVEENPVIKLYKSTN